MFSRENAVALLTPSLWKSVKLPQMRLMLATADKIEILSSHILRLVGQSVQTWFSEWPWEILPITLFWGFKFTCWARFPLPELTARVNGPSWRVTGFHYPSTRAVLTGDRFPLAALTRAVNSGSGNRALGLGLGYSNTASVPARWVCLLV